MFVIMPLKGVRKDSKFWKHSASTLMSVEMNVPVGLRLVFNQILTVASDFSPALGPF